MLMISPPKRTFQSAVSELVDGLGDGSITLRNRAEQAIRAIGTVIRDEDLQRLLQDVDLKARGVRTIMLPGPRLLEDATRVRQIMVSLLREHGYGDVEVKVEW